MKTIKQKYTMVIAYGLMWYSNAVLAVEVTRPNFVKNVNANALQEAGNEVYIWVSAAFMTVLMLSAIRPAWFFMRGEKEKAMENAQDIMWGALFGVFFGGVVFAVMDAVG